MKIVALSSGIMAISTVDILSVPDLKTISSVENKDLLQSHRNKIVPLLTEIHRYTLAELGSESSSVEIVWTSVPVQGQPFEAEIKLSLIIRCIAKTEDLAISAAKHITDLFAIHLESERFRYEINSTDLAGYLNEDSRHVSRTIVKSSRTNLYLHLM